MTRPGLGRIDGEKLMRWFPWLLLFAFLVSGIQTPKAQAGGTWCSQTEWKAAQRAKQRWRARGKQALSALVRALCSDNSCLSAAAGKRLVRTGLPGARALLRGMKRGVCPGSDSWRPVGETLGHSLVLHLDSSRSWKRLATKLLTALDSKNADQARNAMEAVAEVGSAVRKDQVPRAQKRKPLLLQFLDRALSRIHPMLTTPGHPLADAALTLARDLGPLAARALPALTQNLKARRNEKATLQALEAMGSAAVPALPTLLRFMRRASLNRQMETVAVLAAIGKPAASARKDLFGLLSKLLHLAGQGTGRTGGGLSVGWALSEVLRALASVGGPWSRHERTLLFRTANAKRMTLRARSRAATLLARMGLAAGSVAARRVALALKKSHLADRLRPIEPQRLPPPRVRASRWVQYALQVCAAEANSGQRAAGHPASCNADTLSVNQLHRLADCLFAHICGPNRSTMDRVVKQCCVEARSTVAP